MIQEQDIFGALELLHPELCEMFKQRIKQMQRKLDTFELKSVPQNDQRVATLERVNKEMKKQLNCYKEEIESY